MPLLDYFAGSRALAAIKEQGLVPGLVRAWVGPATGPRWLGLYELDRTIPRLGLLEAGRGAERPLLVGASAGAWRSAALLAPHPMGTLERLKDEYIGQVFDRQSSRAEISEAYARLLATVFPPEVADAILRHPGCDLGVLTTRVSPAAAARGQRLWLTLAGAALRQWLRPGSEQPALRRTLLHSAPERFTGVLGGDLAHLTPTNLLSALLASGSVPGYLEPVSIAGASPGAYLDGGLTDYHLAQRMTREPVVLVTHYSSRLLASWFDKRLGWRRSPSEVLRDVLLVCPRRAYVERLPGGRWPDRKDFWRWANAPRERIERWHEAARRSSDLGAEFEADLRSGRLVEQLKALGVA